MEAQVGHLCVYAKQNSVGIFVPVFLWSEPGCLVEFLPISFEDMSWHIQRPVYSLFTAAALFYLDIPHKNSIELCSVGCSLAAFEDEIFAGVFSGQRPASPTVHMKQHHSSKHNSIYSMRWFSVFLSRFWTPRCHLIKWILAFYVKIPTIHLFTATFVIKS